MRVTREAAMLFTVTTAGVILFQLALALGAPWGSFAMGGDRWVFFTILFF
jgi:hypothetical protein